MRQWITYDGNATLFSERDQIYFSLIGDQSKPDNAVVEHVSTDCWLRTLMRDWEFDEHQVDGLIWQLNLGQSADLLNRHDRQLRVWVDPKTAQRRRAD